MTSLDAPFLSQILLTLTVLPCVLLSFAFMCHQNTSSSVNFMGFFTVGSDSEVVKLYDLTSICDQVSVYLMLFLLHS